MCCDGVKMTEEAHIRQALRAVTGLRDLMAHVDEPEKPICLSEIAALLDAPVHHLEQALEHEMGLVLRQNR